MKMNQKLILLTLFFLAISVNSKATLITFDDRAVFESFVTNFTIDGLDNIHQGNYLSGINRGSYKFTTSVYGCVNNFDCGNNTSQGFNPNYLSTSGSGTFEFDSGINAFGLDFGVYDGSNYGSNLLAKITLNAQSRNTKAIIGDGTSNFFGIVDTANTFKTVSYSRLASAIDGNRILPLGSGGIIDNVTYGLINTVSAVPVPTPATIWLFASGILGLIGATRRKHQLRPPII